MTKQDYTVYPTFSEVENSFLRSYNRIGIAINITDKLGEAECEKYLSQFTDGDKKMVHLCGEFIKKFGLEEVKKQAFAAADKEMAEAKEAK